MRLQTRINSAVGKGLVEEGGICVNEFGINVRQVILTVHTGSVFRRFSKFFFFLFMERINYSDYKYIKKHRDR